MNTQDWAVIALIAAIYCTLVSIFACVVLVVVIKLYTEMFKKIAQEKRDGN